MPNHEIDLGQIETVDMLPEQTRSGRVSKWGPVAALLRAEPGVWKRVQRDLPKAPGDTTYLKGKLGLEVATRSHRDADGVRSWDLYLRYPIQ